MPRENADLSANHRFRSLLNKEPLRIRDLKAAGGGVEPPFSNPELYSLDVHSVYYVHRDCFCPQ
jgi:hypothetical protein